MTARTWLKRGELYTSLRQVYQSHVISTFSLLLPASGEELRSGTWSQEKLAPGPEAPAPHQAALPAGGRRAQSPAVAPASRSAGTAPLSGSGPPRTLARSAALPRAPSLLPPPQPGTRTAQARLGLVRLPQRGSRKGRSGWPPPFAQAPAALSWTVLRSGAHAHTHAGTHGVPRTSAGFVTGSLPGADKSSPCSLSHRASLGLLGRSSGALVPRFLGPEFRAGSGGGDVPEATARHAGQTWAPAGGR